MVIISCILAAIAGLILALAHALVSRRLQSSADNRTGRIRNDLPGTDCGLCSYEGCYHFAKALAEGKTDPAVCLTITSTALHQIAETMGMTPAKAEPMMAVVHCKGGLHEARQRAHYAGLHDCWAAIIAGNGDMECIDGCLGLETCVAACPFGAITVNKNRIAAVDQERCTGCGRCIAACPRRLIELVPRIHKIYLACSNHDRGARVKRYCTAGCTACTLCVKATPSGAITIEDNLPRLDYSHGENFVPAAYKCPSNSFVDLVKARPKVNISPTCTGCGECIPSCPVEAITGDPGQRHVIDKEKCIGCGICLNVCRFHAISLWGGLGYRKESVKRGRR
jgi:Na+-translocating ferredoxin:NAD+ oxidoreductase RNF subunit RnfB